MTFISFRASGAALALSLALCAGPAAAQACGGEGNLCAVESGEYRIALPEGEGPHPVFLFIHGYGGNANGSVRLISRAVERGYAAIAPQGLRRDGDSGPTTWSFHPDRQERRDESAFMREVLSDAAERFGIDADRVVIGGFSLGGSMATYIGCEDPGIARGYAPVAGAFWRPHPGLDACAGPVDVHYTHGWTDGTVPLEGRVLGGGTILQGDAFYALQIWRETNGCDRMMPDDYRVDGDIWERDWTSCTDGSLHFVLHPGGHMVPRGWTDDVLDWFETLD